MKTKEKIPAITEITLSYKNRVPAARRIIIDSTDLAVQLFRKSWNPDTIELLEEFKVMLLDVGCKLLGILPLAKGGMVTCTVDHRLILAAALKAGSSSIIIAHNHPSGALEPSLFDKATTCGIKAGARILGITLRDHLILSRTGYFSFQRKGIL
jgi:DNA repair protein RadC